MGLFNFFRSIDKQTSEKDTIDEKQIIPQLQNVLFDDSKTLEEKQKAYSAIRDEEERRINEMYDTNSIEGIKSIPVPCKEVNGDSSTGRVEYYLRGQCFFNHWKSGRVELALACLRKAQELMFVSDMVWRRSDYLRLVAYLYEAGKDAEAEEQIKKIDSFLEKQDIKQDAKIKSIELASSLGTDLVEVLSCPTPYCEECAKYLNRIYSISGEDNRFPKLPEGFTSREPGHHFSCLRVYPFSYGITPLSFDCEDVISYSNRPFIDERTEEQIEEYNTYLRSKEEEAKLQRKNEDFMLENAKRKRTDLNNLQWLKENIPDIAPKSLSGFRRMRTTNSKNYQKIVEEAAKLGKNI